MAQSSSSSSLVSVNPPSTVPYIKCNFLDKNTGNVKIISVVFPIKLNIYIILRFE
jgi:hypothetical protein